MPFSYKPLWKLLVEKDMTKTELRDKIKASSATMTKMSKDEYVSMRVLDDICEVLEVDCLSEIVEFVSLKFAIKKRGKEIIIPSEIFNKNSYKKDPLSKLKVSVVKVADDEDYADYYIDMKNLIKSKNLDEENIKELREIIAKTKNIAMNNNFTKEQTLNYLDDTIELFIGTIKNNKSNK